MSMIETVAAVVASESIVMAFVVVAAVMGLSELIARFLTRGRIHASAIALVLALGLAYAGGLATGGSKGLADVKGMAGLAMLGGASLRDLAIVATAFGARLDEVAKAGAAGLIALVVGIATAFAVGGAVAFAFGYRDAVSLTTIGAGAATYIVGPVTGSALGASPAVIALSVAVGITKAIACMVLTPLVARTIGLTNPRTAMIYGGLLGTTSGVAAGLAAVDSRLVPYGAMTATFYTGLGCLVGPSLAYAVFWYVCR
jgi:malonate transporter MadM subunit